MNGLLRAMLSRNVARSSLTLSRRVLSTSPLSRSPASATAYPFLPSNHLPAKPRKSGLTEIRGPYYAPVTQTYLDDLLSDWGEYVDGVKFAGGSFTLMPEERLRGLIETAHKHSMSGSLPFVSLIFNSLHDRLLCEHWRLHREGSVVIKWRPSGDLEILADM